MIHSKNQMIRSMKSYEVGGSSDDPCIEIVMVDGKPKKRKKQKCGAGKTKRVYSPKEIGKTVESVGPIKRKLKKALRNKKNAIKNPGGGSHKPQFKKKCGAQ
jgi:hypothetical protein